jgi:hypothetical protein
MVELISRNISVLRVIDERVQPIFGASKNRLNRGTLKKLGYQEQQWKLLKALKNKTITFLDQRREQLNRHFGVNLKRAPALNTRRHVLQTWIPPISRRFPQSPRTGHHHNHASSDHDCGTLLPDQSDGAGHQLHIPPAG